MDTIIDHRSKLEMDSLYGEETAQGLVEGIVRCRRGARFERTADAADSC